MAKEEEPAPGAKTAAFWCQVCGEERPAERWVECPRCESRHHQGCWEYIGHCSTYGCAAEAWRASPEPRKSARELLPRWLAWAPLIALFLFFLWPSPPGPRPAAPLPPTHRPRPPTSTRPPLPPAPPPAPPASDPCPAPAARPEVPRRRKLVGHVAQVTGLSFTPDGRRVASSSWDGSVRVWSVEDGREVRRHIPAGGRGPRLAGVSLAADAGSVTVLDSGGRVTTLRDPSGKDQRPLLERAWYRAMVHRYGAAMAESDDRRLVAASVDESQLAIWDVESGNRTHLLRGAAARVTSLAFFPGARELAAGLVSGEILTWDLGAPDHPRAVGRQRYPVLSLATASGGDTLASGGRGEELHLWRRVGGVWDGQTLDAGRAGLPENVSAGHVEALGFSPNGRILAASDRGTHARLFATHDGSELAKLEVAAGRLRALTFSPDGRFLASGGADDLVSLWEVDPAVTRGAAPLRDPLVRAPAASEDGGVPTFRVEDLCEPRDYRKATLYQHVKAVAFPPAGPWIGFGHIGKASFWDPVTGAQRAMKPRESELFSGGIMDRLYARRVAFSPDGSRFYAPSQWAIREFDPATGEELRRISHPETLVAAGLDITPDGKTLAAGSSLKDNEVTLFELPSGRFLRKLLGHRKGVHALRFSPRGDLLATGGYANEIFLWDHAAGEIRRRLRGHGHWIEELLFSADGATLISASLDRSVRFWDVASGEVTRVLEGHHSDGVHGIALSPDGILLATTSQDGSLLLWDLRANRPFLRLTGKTEEDFEGVAFSPDFRWLVAGSSYGHAYAFELTALSKLLGL